MKYLTLKGRTWWFHRDIPKPLRQAFEGRKTITQRLGASDLRTAQRRRDLAFVESEKAFLRAAKGARSGLLDALTEQGRAWAEEHHRWREDPLAWARSVSPSIHVEREEDAITWHETLEDTADTIGREHGSEAREHFFATAHGALPIDHHLEAHLIESGLPARTVRARRTAVKRVATWRPTMTLTRLERKQAGEYVSGTLAKGHPVTGNNAISHLSRYWDWLVSRGHATGNPWRGQRLDKRRAAAAEPEREFTKDEVVTLLGSAYPKGWDHRDRLHDAMRIAALSGLRIDEICRLTVGDCRDGLFDIRRGKTKAGKRQVPIHSALAPMVKRRSAAKKPEAYLFHEIEKAGEGERSMPLSKQFTRYRRELGVDHREDGQRRSLVNFHSFRRWFITMAERAGQPPHIIEAVVGHKRAGMSLGRYSGGPSVEKQMRECVEAVRLPATAR